MGRKLKAEWSFESAQQFDIGTDGTFKYVPDVKWYQFKRYKLLFKPTEDYLKSRLYFLQLCKIMVEDIAAEIVEEAKTRCNFCTTHTVIRHRLKYHFWVAERITKVLAVVTFGIIAVCTLIKLSF